MGGACDIRAVLFDAAGTLLLPREPVGATYARFARRYLASSAGLAANSRLAASAGQSPAAAPSAARLGEAFARVFESAPANAHPDAPPGRRAALERAWWQARLRETFRAADQELRFEESPHFGPCADALWLHYGSPRAWRLAAGAEQALAALRAQGLTLAILSNFDQRLHGLLRGLNVRCYFDAVVLPAESGAAKPSPAIFAHCLAQLGIAPRQALLVGDHPVRDLQAARAAGLHALDIRQLPAAPAASGAHNARAGGFAALPAVVERMNRRAQSATPGAAFAARGRAVGLRA